jgi:hypothetical protein
MKLFGTFEVHGGWGQSHCRGKGAGLLSEGIGFVVIGSLWGRIALWWEFCKFYFRVDWDG